MKRNGFMAGPSETMKKAMMKRPQIRLDQESFDSETHLAFVRGWVLSENPVKLRVYDEEKNRVRFSPKKEVRKDIQKEFPSVPVPEDCGFYGEFPAESGKLYYLVARENKGRPAVRRILIPDAERQGDKKVSSGSEKIRRIAFSAAEQAGRLQDYGVGGTLQVFLGKAARKAGRTFNYPSYWYSLVRTHEGELEEQKNDPPRNGPVFRILVTDAEDRKPGKTLLQSLEGQTYRNWTARREPAEEETGKRGYVLFCRKEDRLEPDALYRLADHLERNPDTELLYPDELRRPLSGIGVKEILLKPDFNPELLCSANYIGHVFAVSERLAAATGVPAGGVSPDVAELDYILKCTERTNKIGHVPGILYETRENDKRTPMLVKEMIPVIRAHYRRTGYESSVVYDAKNDVFRIRLAVKGDPKVSILIPNKDHAEDLRKCIDSIRAKSTWKNYEILVIENNSSEEKTFRYYDELEKTCPEVHILYYTGCPEIKDGRILKKEADRPFNYPDLNNYGAEQASGEYLLLLNNDTEVITEDWLERMLGFCQRENTGIVGARLYYPDDTIQHAGVIVGLSGGAEHAGAREPRNKAGYMKRYTAAQDLSAVTAACMMVRKSVYKEMGGMDPDYAVSFNDVDFCLRVREAGYLIVYDADVELYHYESKSRGNDATKEQTERAMKELKLLQTRHGRFMELGDPYYHPWLHPSHQDYSLADPEYLNRNDRPSLSYTDRE